jgi:alpha-tubulin suppressor-like RCC1 family protein
VLHVVDVGSRRRLRALLVVAALGGAACNAIVGVETVALGPGRVTPGEDAEAPTEDAESPPTDGGPTPDEPLKVQVALGYIHTCARRLDGTVLCWGENGAGQIGDGVPFDGSRPEVTIPQRVVNIRDATQVAAGISHTCALRRTGGVSCWGLNFFGQLGDGTKTRTSSPVDVQGLTDAIFIAAGTSFTCAVRRDETAACWGANYAGQLGDDTKDDRTTPVRVQQLSEVLAIAAAEYHACALSRGGTVRCWGQNDEGQLGIGSLVESLTPRAVASLSDIVAIAAASRFSCALRSTGLVYCWGANNLGQLGTGSASPSPNPSPVLVTGITNARAIWAGYEHACAALETGKVMCWGQAGRGQLGTGSPGIPLDAAVPRPSEVVGMDDAIRVVTGGEHTCATTAAGALYCWGSNNLGELGNGTKVGAFSAAPVTGFP